MATAMEPGLPQLSSIASGNAHLSHWNVLIPGNQRKINHMIVGVKTNDNVQVMLLKKVVDESQVLRQAIKLVQAKGLITVVDMDHKAFDAIIPYLKLGVELTRIKQEVAGLTSPQIREELEPNIDHARRELIKTIETYSKVEWKRCIKAAILLRIDTVHDAAVIVGRKNGWIKEPSKPKLAINNN